ncbi:MAG: hypothetical protein RL033_1057, partial [Pseudomonadota bacterium]
MSTAKPPPPLRVAVLDDYQGIATD